MLDKNIVKEFLSLSKEEKELFKNLLIHYKKAKQDFVDKYVYNHTEVEGNETLELAESRQAEIAEDVFMSLGIKNFDYEAWELWFKEL